MRYFSLIVLCVLALSACTEQQKDTMADLPTTESGCAYDMHVDAEGANCQVGEQVTFQIVRRFDDSITYSSYNLSEPAKMVIPDPTLPNGQLSLEIKSVVDMLGLMSIGDSATVYIDMDSLLQRPQGAEGRKHLIYDIKVLETKDLKAEENRIATICK